MRRWKWLALVAAAGMLASAAAAFGATAHHTAGATLVVDNSFTIKTSDPQRAFDPTASIIDRALYDTLFTYKGGDLANPIPLLVSSWKATNGAKTFTFQLKKNAHFADGTPLTSADVVFSMNRLVNIKGNPAFLLAGVTVKAQGKYGVVMTSATPDTELPAILANPSTGIVNSKLVKAHGGTSAANASTADKAETWLNTPASAGAGSGPYILKSFSTTSQVVLAPNPKYWGPKKPAFSTVVVRNMIATTQLINVQRGTHEIAIDLSADQATGLKGNSKLHVSLAALDLGVLAVREQRPEGLHGDLERAVAAGGPIRARLQVDPVGRRPGCDPGSGTHPVDVPRLAAAEERRQAGRCEGEGSARGVRAGSQQVTLQYPSRPHDQRCPVHDDGGEGSGEPPGRGLQHPALRLPDVELADRVPQRPDGVRPVALGP